jgi:ketosteroid isomerase-like protein
MPDGDREHGRVSANIDIVRAGLKAYGRGDFDALAQTVHPDVELHDWPEAADPRVYRGPDAILEAREEWSKAWDSVDVEPTGFAEAGNRVLAVLKTTGKGRGSSIEMAMETYGVYTLRDGKASKIQFFTNRDAALEAAEVTDEQIRQEAQ